MSDLTQDQVGHALANLGNYRVLVTQEYAAQGDPDGISGALLLSLGLRETGLKNINNQAQTDHGWCQISEVYHSPWLHSEPGCPVGKWTAVPGHSAVEDGYAPRFTPALHYAVKILHDAQTYGRVKGVRGSDIVSFAVAAYNAGVGGALSGYRVGNVDKYTTGGDYSAWVLRHKPLVAHWLDAHPNWRYEAA